MKTSIITFSILLTIIALPAYAGHDKPWRKHSSGHFYDYARVNSVTPIIKTIEHRSPRQCRHKHRPQHSNTPVIIGSILGAALGNNLGHHKSNKRVGAVAGGVLGASIASDLYSSKHHCNSGYDIEYEQQVTGYTVHYSYRGVDYSTQTEHHPGKRIQLRLQFEPVVS